MLKSARKTAEQALRDVVERRRKDSKKRLVRFNGRTSESSGDEIVN